jgi:hypothetical protein
MQGCDKGQQAVQARKRADAVSVLRHGQLLLQSAQGDQLGL